jgi:hypothetical protein
MPVEGGPGSCLCLRAGGLIDMSCVCRASKRSSGRGRIREHPANYSTLLAPVGLFYDDLRRGSLGRRVLWPEVRACKRSGVPLCEREKPSTCHNKSLVIKLAAASTWAGVDLAELGTVVGGGK